MKKGTGGRAVHHAIRLSVAFALASVLLVASASGVDAAAPPATGKIAFEVGGDIWTVERNGTGLAQLTSGPHEDADPAWSPTGRHLAFVRNGRIHVMDGDGSNIRQITTSVPCVPGQPSVEDHRHPDWTWDAQSVLFAVRNPCNSPTVTGTGEWIGRVGAFGSIGWQWALSDNDACPDPVFDVVYGGLTLPAASPVSENFVVTSGFVCMSDFGGGALLPRERVDRRSAARVAALQSELGMDARSTHVKRPGALLEASSAAFADPADPTTYFEYGMQAYFPSEPLAATIAFTTKEYPAGTPGEGDRYVLSSALYRGGGAGAQLLAETGDELTPGWCIRNIAMPDIPLDGGVVAAMYEATDCVDAFRPENSIWGYHDWQGVDFRWSDGILLMDADGTNKRVLEVGGDSSDPDVQCAPGSCLTGLRIVQAYGPLSSTDRLSYSGAVTGTIGEGEVLFQKLGTGVHQVTQALSAAHPLQSIECSDQPLSQSSVQTNLAQRSLQVTLTEGDLVTCVFTNKAEDEGGCESTNTCDSDGDGIPDTDDPCPTDPTNACVNDGDYLPKNVESTLGTDPEDPDTDNDGYWDGVEHVYGSHPLLAGSTPVAPPGIDQHVPPSGTAINALLDHVDCIEPAGTSLNTCALRPGDIVLWRHTDAKGRAESFLGVTHFTHAAMVIGRFDMSPGGTDSRLHVVLADITPPPLFGESSREDFGLSDLNDTDAAGGPDGLGFYRPDLNLLDREAAARQVLGLALSNGAGLSQNQSSSFWGAPTIKYGIDPLALAPPRLYCSSLVAWAYGAHFEPDYEAFSKFDVDPLFITPDDLLTGFSGVAELGGYNTDAGITALFSPAHVLITDPQGRRSGKDSQGTLHDEIPGALWRDNGQAEGVSVPGIGPGWVVTLGGYETGTYALFVRTLAEGAATQFVVGGFTRPGKVETYQFADLAGLAGRPVAVDDSANAAPSQSITVDVVANDFDPDGNLSPATLQVDRAPANGTASIVGGQVRYISRAGFLGTDSLDYRVCDTASLCSLGRLVVTVAVTCNGRAATWIGGPRNDTFSGTKGSDVVVDTGGNNHIKTGAGNDTVCLGNGIDVVDLGDGTDHVEGGNGLNVIQGGAGRDTVVTGNDRDVIETGSDDDEVHAGDGDNLVRTGAGGDSVTTGTGNDTIDGGAGTDVCKPGSGTNRVVNCER